MKNKKNMFIGIILIVVGLLLGLYTFDIIKFNIFFDGWWTLFIIIPSAIGLVNDEDKVGQAIGVAVGVVLLLCCQHLISFDLLWKLLLPTIIVVIGLSFIFKDYFKKEVIEKMNEIEEKTGKVGEEICATFSGQDIYFNDKTFKGATLTAAFGGIKYDLIDAKINKDVIIDATSIFGGIDISLPSNVKVEIKSTSIFGGVSDERKNVKTDKDAVTVYINATCIFGGVTIK